MAQIELRLSAKTDKITGLNEVLIRFYEGSKFNLRSKTGIFVSKKHFEFYINREATEKKGIKIKTKDITATRSEAEKKGYVLLDRGIIVSNGIVENEDKRIHDLAIKKAKELCEHIINSFNESDKSSISNDWLKITIEKYLNPSKYQEKEIERPSFFQIFETFLNEKASSDSVFSVRRYSLKSTMCSRLIVSTSSLKFLSFLNIVYASHLANVLNKTR